MAEVSVFLGVAYHGRPFHGFARQEGLPTVQGALEEALSQALRREVLVTGAGRTDAGVHATGQVVSFSAEDSSLPSPAALARSVDALTPSALAVGEVRMARAGADARFSALARRYRYRLSAGGARPVLAGDLVWRVRGSLDLDAMRAGASWLLGEHDFASFCVTASAEGKRTVRDIETLDVCGGEVAGEPVVEVVVEGASFLHSMVRIVVGTLVEVGRGAWPPQRVAEALAARERAAAGPTAPARGLVLESVRYPEDIWLPEQG
jgi:tRNA pseudouridine38-40 synthase